MTAPLSSQSEPEYPQIPSDEEIIAQCHDYLNASRTLQLSEDVFVKFGSVYRYFSRDGVNFLVMEYVNGAHRDLVEDAESIKTVAQAIKHLQQFSNASPGPFGGGTSQELLWESEETELLDVPRMETYFNRRLVDRTEKLSFHSDKLVLNHLDIAPRNIIWKEDGSICLVDWTSAGFYPAIFERTSLCINTKPQDFKFASLLIDELGAGNSVETEAIDQTRMELIDRARFNGHRYYIVPLERSSSNKTLYVSLDLQEQDLGARCSDDQTITAVEMSRRLAAFHYPVL